MIQV
jgi:hypothetical protein